MQTEEVDVVVIGAGVVGLAVARALAMDGRSVLILERHGHLGEENSSRNSEVIHAGIYYPQGSRKAELCVRGKHLLYDYCKARNVAHRRCGKIIVATSGDQLDALAGVHDKAINNGVTDLTPLGQDSIRLLEPEIYGLEALLSPSTGIVDSHGLMVAFLTDAEEHDAMLVCHSSVTGGEVAPNRTVLKVDSGGEDMALSCRLVINSAGLSAGRISDKVEGLPDTARKTIHYARGNYFVPAGRSPKFSRLIYPVPEKGGLGVHVTIDLAGQVRFGPNVEWLEANGEDPSFAVNPSERDRFEDAISRYWRPVRDQGLNPGYAGVRPKLFPRGQGDGDFIIQGADETGSPHWINLYGIESPGLTASLAIAEEVAALARVSA
ncbi:MAG: NAD(P)/FAD-dependent oxidoreductase [Pseudomonadota bacterium]